MKLGALMVDYDGTIAPLGVRRSESRVFKSVEAELRKIAKLVPVCIVTAKDFEFVHPRSQFASGWACVSGLDVRLPDGRRFPPRRLAGLDGALRIASSFEKQGSYTEFKHGQSGELLAVAIDWTKAPQLGPAILRRLKSLSDSGPIVSLRHRPPTPTCSRPAPTRARQPNC